MPRGIVRPVSGIWPLVAIITIGTIAVLLGWSISEGMTGLPIYVLQGLALFSFAMVSPSVGLTFFFLIVHVLAFIPVDILLPGSRTEFYVFGLSAANVVFLVLVLAWWMRFIVVQREFLPMGPVGKVLIIFTGFVTVNLLRTLVVRAFFGAYDPVTLFGYLSLWRSSITVPLFAFMVINTQFSQRTFRFVLWAYVILVCFGTSFCLLEILRYSGSKALLSELRSMPVGLEMLALPVVTVGLYMATHLRNLVGRAVWIILVVVAVLPILYLQRRAAYITLLLQGILTFAYLVKEAKSRRAIVIVLLAGAAVGMVYYLPHEVIDRVTYTFFDPTSGTQRLDPSGAMRLRFWRVFLDPITHDWWILLTGVGFGRSVVVMRESIGTGLSFHNTWMVDVIDGGIWLLIIHVMVLLTFFRTFRIMQRHPDPLVKSFASGLMISIVAAIPYSWLHELSMNVGQYAMMLWFIASLVMVQTRPGGMFADMRAPDGRTGREIVGLPPAESRSSSKPSGADDARDAT